MCVRGRVTNEWNDLQVTFYRAAITNEAINDYNSAASDVFSSSKMILWNSLARLSEAALDDMEDGLHLPQFVLKQAVLVRLISLAEQDLVKVFKLVLFLKDTIARPKLASSYIEPKERSWRDHFDLFYIWLIYRFHLSIGPLVWYSNSFLMKFPMVLSTEKFW